MHGWGLVQYTKRREPEWRNAKEDCFPCMHRLPCIPASMVWVIGHWPLVSFGPAATASSGCNNVHLRVSHCSVSGVPTLLPGMTPGSSFGCWTDSSRGLFSANSTRLLFCWFHFFSGQPFDHRPSNSFKRVTAYPEDFQTRQGNTVEHSRCISISLLSSGETLVGCGA